MNLKQEYLFLQADSSQAEARVVWLLADDEEALKLVDEIDYHAFTATWFFGLNEELHNYDKKKLGYEHPIRFCGKTLRHAGHLGASKRRAAITVNTDARKYKIPIVISEQTAERALRIFHTRQPKIQSIFQNGITEIIKQTRKLVAPVPYGLDVDYGGTRTFFDRMGEELFRQAFSYIPQRAVTDNTKCSGLRIRDRIPGIKIAIESHDSLLFIIPAHKVIDYGAIIRDEFERPISFLNCSIKRRDLIIPCEIEIGNNYKDLKKFRNLPPSNIVNELIIDKPISKEELFSAVVLPDDTKLDDIVYRGMERKFYMGDS